MRRSGARAASALRTRCAQSVADRSLPALHRPRVGGRRQVAARRRGPRSDRRRGSCAAAASPTARGSPTGPWSRWSSSSTRCRRTTRRGRCGRCSGRRSESAQRRRDRLGVPQAARAGGAGTARRRASTTCTGRRRRCSTSSSTSPTLHGRAAPAAVHGPAGAARAPAVVGRR